MKVAHMRKKLGLRQQDLAEQAGITRTYVSLIENGHADGLTLDTAKKIADALDSSIDDVFFN